MEYLFYVKSKKELKNLLEFAKNWNVNIHKVKTVGKPGNRKLVFSFTPDVHLSYEVFATWNRDRIFPYRGA